MRKVFSLFFLVTLFFSFSCQAARTMPRVGRTAWTLVQQATPQPIEAEDSVGGVITIDESGNYQLYEDLSGITINLAANNISLDLNGHLVEQTDADENVIEVAADMNNIVIFNGIVQNIGGSGSGSGITIAENTKNIFVQDIRFYGCATGIAIAGLDTQEVLFAQIVDCNFFSCLGGISADYCQDLLIENVSIENDPNEIDSGTGISLDQGISNAIIDGARVFKYEYGINLGFNSTNFEIIGCKVLNCELEDVYTGIAVHAAKKITLQDITIRKSSTAASGGYGIWVFSAILFPFFSSTDISMNNVNVLGIGSGGFEVGIYFFGQSGYEITKCELVNCNCTDNSTGFKFQYADDNVIRDCVARRSLVSGFELLQSETNTFQNCQALETAGDASVAGFKTDSGKNNLFEGCIAKGTITRAIDFGNTAHGFLLTGTEEDSKIIDCIVNETACIPDSLDLTTTTSAVAYGIQLRPVLLPEVESGTLTRLETEGTIQDQIALQAIWSPNSRYIFANSNQPLATSTPGRPVLFGFDQEYLAAIYWNQTEADEKTDFGPSWSPDGRHISYCDQDEDTPTPKLLVERRDGARVVNVTSLSDSSASYFYGSAWSGNGMFVAYISHSTTTPTTYVNIRDFDGEALPNQVSASRDYNNILAIDWSPDDQYIALANAENLRILLFLEGGDIDSVATESTNTDLTAVAWSPNGKFIAAGDATKLYVYSFGGPWSDDVDPDLELVLLDELTIGVPVTSIAWSPDGKYIINNGFSSDNTYINISRFDPGQTSGSRIAPLANAQLPEEVFSVDWSACGRYVLASTGVAGVRPGGLIIVFPVMNAPINCLLERNTVAGTLSFNTLVGIGIAAGGINSFFSNICCENEDDFSYGVPNVFYDDQNTPRPFDNIATQRPQYLMLRENYVDTRPSNMA